MDVVGDFITILRNASASKRSACIVQWSALRENLASILKREGYISDYIKEQNDKHIKFSLRIFLKYVNDIPESENAYCRPLRVCCPGKWPSLLVLVAN